MPTWFDESRLDDEVALGAADLRLRTLAESGARVRRAAGDAAEAIAEAVAASHDNARPRAVIAAGPDSRLLRAVLEPWCPVPFVAWPAPALPGWAGSLDLVVVLAPDGRDRGHRLRRRGGRSSRMPGRRGLPAELAGRRSRRRSLHIDPAGDQRRPAGHRGRDARLPRPDGTRSRAPTPSRSPTALDDVATRRAHPTVTWRSTPPRCWRSALADANPLVWGGSVLAARAARRVAESIRRASGRTALAGDAEHLLPVIEAARPRRRLRRPVRRGRR